MFIPHFRTISRQRSSYYRTVTLWHSFYMALLTKLGVNMAGYWNCVLIDRERGQYPAILAEQALSIIHI